MPRWYSASLDNRHTVVEAVDRDIAAAIATRKMGTAATETWLLETPIETLLEAYPWWREYTDFTQEEIELQYGMLVARTHLEFGYYPSSITKHIIAVILEQLGVPTYA